MNKTILLGLVLALPLAACEKKAQTAQPTASAPNGTAGATGAASAVGDDPALPKIAVGTAAKCPVTGEDFTVKATTTQVTYDGKRYAFCCADCQPSFAKDPAKYAKK
jgi:YHS domain-containing protein